MRNSRFIGKALPLVVAMLLFNDNGDSIFATPSGTTSEIMVKNSTPETGLALKIYDSKHSAEGETVKRISFQAVGSTALTGTMTADLSSGQSGQITEGSDKITVEVDYEMTVCHGIENACEIGIAIFPQDGITGIISVETDRGSYEFQLSEPMTVSAGMILEVALDLSSADSSPLRKVGILGDSISTFIDYIDPSYGTYYPRGDVQSVEDTYWYKLIYNYMPNATVDVNSSYSGTRVSTDPTYPGYDFVSRCLAFDDPDIIIIHGGTNDSNNKVAVGTYDYDTDLESLNPDYFRSAYIKLIKKIRQNYGDVRIICIVGDRLGSEYATSVVEIAEYFGLPYVSFYGDGDNIPKVTGSHPTTAGFEYMAGQIYSALEDYLQ